MRVAVLTCGSLPSFVTWEIEDTDDLFADDVLLIAAFRERGIDAERVVWSDPQVDWDQYDVALVRSTWDYVDDRERFLRVLAGIDASSCLLLNPLDAVTWSSDKGYLMDLPGWGVPAVPTYRASDAEPADLEASLLTSGRAELVLKPTVGAGAAGIERVPAHRLAEALTDRNRSRRLQDVLVQPLVESVVTEGEWSYVYLGGELSHVLLKRPAAGDYRAHGIYGGTVAPAPPTHEDIVQVDAIVERLPFDTLYARVDLVRIDGRLCVLELELVEPMLYLALDHHAAGQLARATIDRLGRSTQ